MDQTLSRFVDKTHCDPSFARDLLEGKKWDFDEALKAFQELSLGANEASSKEKKKITKPQRGISVVNSDIVQRARTKVQENNSHSPDSHNLGFEAMVRFTFVMPDLSSYPQEFADFLREDLIETSALVALEQSGHLNWWSDIGICQRLVPLATVGDGNCLLHAASLGMWGYHDRLLTLRKALLKTLVSDSASTSIKRRWRFQQYQRNMEAGGLVYTEEEWEKEWLEVLRLASTNRKKMNNTPKLNKHKSLPFIEEGEKVKPIGHHDSKERGNGDSLESNSQPNSENKEKTLTKCTSDENTKTDIEDKKEQPRSYEENGSESQGAFESLEEIHVFVLAHVLRRTIIIIADKYLRDFSGDPIAPIPFGGIFLPCECPPKTCLKTPLILAFDSAHFSAVVVSEGHGKQGNLVNAIPVVNIDYELLPIHFSVDPGVHFDWTTLGNKVDHALPAKLSLTKEQKLELLEKYLDIIHVKVSAGTKSTQQQGKVEFQKSSQMSEKKKEVAKDDDKALSWLNSKFNLVGNLAGKIKGSSDLNIIFAAKLKTNEKPEYYDEMIENYIISAKERFDERQKAQKETQSDPSSRYVSPCITTGCQMFGSADTNYLCSGCYKTQKSASEARLYTKPLASEQLGEGKASFKSYISQTPTYPQIYPDYDNHDTKPTTTTTNIPSSAIPEVLPPSYAEACQSNISAGNRMCLKDGCSFYGSHEKKGYCSSCYKIMSA